jgi:carbamoyl-phosphate synthase large subunit
MRRNIIFLAKKIADMGFKICASEGTCKVLRSNGVNAKEVPKIGEGKPDIIDLIKGDDIDLIINVVSGRKSQMDSKPIRSAAVVQGIPYITTLEAAQAAISGMDSLEKTGFSVKSIQNYSHNILKTRSKDKDANIDFRKSIWNAT